MAILQVNNLTKTYGKGDSQVNALGGVSFSVEKGEFVAIVGASGSGKSTLLHLLGGVDRPTAGGVIVDGNDIYKSESDVSVSKKRRRAQETDRSGFLTSKKIIRSQETDRSGFLTSKKIIRSQETDQLAIFRRRNIGLIYQFYNLIPTLTVEENIMLPRLLDNRKPDPDKLRYILETIGLAERARHLPSELSGGQQQRVAVGRALINDPAIILADEPTGNLDSHTGREVMDLLKLSNKRFNQTLLIITHDENIALQADRVITISDGHILRDEATKPRTSTNNEHQEGAVPRTSTNNKQQEGVRV